MLFVLTMVNDAFVDASDEYVMQLEPLLEHRHVSDSSRFDCHRNFYENNQSLHKKRICLVVNKLILPVNT